MKRERWETQLRGYQMTWERGADSNPPTRVSSFILEGVMAMVQGNQFWSKGLIGVFPSVIC